MGSGGLAPLPITGFGRRLAQLKLARQLLLLRTNCSLEVHAAINQNLYCFHHDTNETCTGLLSIHRAPTVRTCSIETSIYMCTREARICDVAAGPRLSISVILLSLMPSIKCMRLIKCCCASFTRTADVIWTANMQQVSSSEYETSSQGRYLICGSGTPKQALDFSTVQQRGYSLVLHEALLESLVGQGIWVGVGILVLLDTGSLIGRNRLAALWEAIQPTPHKKYM